MLGAIQIRGNNDFAPYEFTNEKGQPAGFNIDLMQAIGRLMGLNFDIQLGQWSKVREALEKGTIDALTGVMYSPERDKLFEFSIPHISISYSIFVRKNSEIRKPEDVKGKKVIVLKDVYAHDWLKRHQFTPHIIAVKRPAEALQLLSSGRHDCAVLIRLHGLELMRDLGIDNLQTVGPPVLTQKMGFAVRAGNTDLLSKLNEGLYTLQTNGEYDKIFLKWFSINEQKRILSKVIQVGKMVTIPLVVVLAVLGFFIWYLNKTVERKTRTIQLREGLLNSIVQGIPAPTLVSDPSGKISHWNRACEKMSGLTASELVGTTVKKIPDRSHPSIYLTILAERFCVHDELDLMWRPMNHSDRQSEVLNAEVYVPWLGDQGRWLYGTIAPFLDEQARPLGVIESWQDFTDKKELETQLLQAQKMEAIGTMARGVAHDFNNYLHVIKSLSESARKETSKNSEGYGYLQQIDKTIQNAADLIKQILTFGHKNLKEPTPIFVKPIVEKTLKMIISMAPDHIDIRQKLASNAMIMADGTQVGQVIMNLCTNALQSMEGRQGILEVQLKEVELSDEYGFNGHGAKSGNFIKLIVSDTGQGIHPEQLNRIFEPFFSTRKNSGGSGMGLAIAHGIVQGYGGKISVASALAQGSRFEVLWPIIEMPANKK